MEWGLVIYFLWDTGKMRLDYILSFHWIFLLFNADFELIISRYELYLND